MFSLIFLGLTVTTSFRLSPILSFNKVDWFHLQLISVEFDLPLRLYFCTVSILGLSIDVYVWIYVLLRDDLVVYHFGSLFLERKRLCHNSLPFYLFWLCFHSEVTCMLKLSVVVNILLKYYIFVYSIYGIEDNDPSWKIYIILFDT